jgi:hypothetical protein
MFNILVSLLPLIIGSAVVPVQIIIAILLLTSAKQGLAKAVAFVAGMTLVRLAQGVIFGFIFAGGSSDTAGGAAESGWIVPTLMLVLAILMLITAYRQWAKDPDPDAPPPKWLALPEKLTPLTALALGAGMILIAAKMWVFTLGAIGTIGEARLGQPSGTIIFLLFVLLAESLLLIPILIRLIVPAQATALLGRVSDWLTAHNRVIVIAVSLIFGLLFLYKGVTGLL